MGNIKVAVSEYEGRIAPVFDCCQCLSIFSQRADGHELIGIEHWSSLPRMARAGRLKALGIDCVLCGGISCDMERHIVSEGIRLIPWLAGEVNEVMAAFREGRLEDPRFAMPGRIGCRRRQEARRRLKAMKAISTTDEKECNDAGI
jgi:predicted Fe-Mo cluster-binding NifX family protein